MKKKIVKIIIAILIILSLGLVILTLYKLYFKPVNIKSLSQELLPGPLTGPSKDFRAQDLNDQKIIELTNINRVNENLSSLVENDLLKKASQRKAEDMFYRQYFEHSSPTGDFKADQLVKEAGYQYKIVGENLALGDFEDEKALVQAWMDSPGHRANILNKDFQEIGVASKLAKFEDRLTWISVQIFAKPMPNCQKPDQNLQNEIETKKTQVNEANQLFEEGQNLVNEGNSKIEQGNKIYQETKNLNEAQLYWDEGQDLQNQGQEKIDQAKIIQDTNSDLSSLVEEYNNQVANYNHCLKN